jgi:predicted small lipoprotein YifL
MLKNFTKNIFLKNVSQIQKILKNKFKFLAVFFMILSVISCGKKSPIEKPDNYSRPDLSNISDEI